MKKEKQNLGKFKKFNQNAKQKKVIIGSIIGVILLIGGIYLYRTYALYEEKKEFNVLKGRISDFTDADVELAIFVDNEEVGHIPERGNYLVEVDCGDKGTGMWSYTSWAVKVSDFDTNTKCRVSFTTQDEEIETPTEDYLVKSYNNSGQDVSLDGYKIVGVGLTSCTASSSINAFTGRASEMGARGSCSISLANNIVSISYSCSYALQYSWRGAFCTENSASYNVFYVKE